MLISTASFAALVVALLGALILWSNPRRIVNRLVCSSSIHLALWLSCLHITTYDRGGLPWLRITCAVGAGVPWHFWLVKESIATGFDAFDGRWIRRCSGWFVISVLLAAMCFSGLFIPAVSSSEHRVLGWGYYAYIVADLVLYSYLFLDTFRTMRTVDGARRLELQVWLGGGCIMTSAIFITMALNALTGNAIFIRLQPVFVLFFYAGTAYTVTTHRIFDASQILRLCANKAALLALVSAVAYAVYSAVARFLPESVAFFSAIIAALLSGGALQGWLDRRFRFFPQDTSARREAFAVASRHSRAGDLEREFQKILQGWGQSDRALILASKNGCFRGGDIALPADCTVIRTLRQLRWATPERIAREKTSPGREGLGGFLRERQLGVLAMGESASVEILAGVGVPASRRPFTYPQVMQLLELTSIFESAFERAELTAKMQHTEQLATVGLLGASLAHEIRNPLVTIKTFVQLLPSHHADEAFRRKFFSLMTDEVARIDRLTEQLLELASPRAYAAQSVGLHAVLKAALDLVTPKATDKGVRLATEFGADPDLAYTDPSAVKQVVLNLCFNAIQAFEGRENDRWIKVSTRRLRGGIEVAVSDSGPGIAPEMQARLFQPFESTKSTGFGLGLAICRDILSGLNATIAVDPPADGRGATFRVTIPCQSSSS